MQLNQTGPDAQASGPAGLAALRGAYFLEHRSIMRNIFMGLSLIVLGSRPLSTMVLWNRRISPRVMVESSRSLKKG